MGRIIWYQSGNPTKYVSQALGIERWQLRDALHKIKAKSGLSGSDSVIIHDDGRVTDARGEDVGNIHDEVSTG